MRNSADLPEPALRWSSRRGIFCETGAIVSPCGLCWNWSSLTCYLGLQAEYEVIGRAAQMPSSPAQNTESQGLPGVHTEAASLATPEAGHAQQQRDLDSGVHDSFLQDALRLQQMNAARASKRVCMLHSCRHTTAAVPFSRRCPHPVLLSGGQDISWPHIARTCWYCHANPGQILRPPPYSDSLPCRPRGM